MLLLVQIGPTCELFHQEGSPASSLRRLHARDVHYVVLARAKFAGFLESLVAHRSFLLLLLFSQVQLQAVLVDVPVEPVDLVCDDSLTDGYRVGVALHRQCDRRLVIHHRLLGALYLLAAEPLHEKEVRHGAFYKRLHLIHVVGLRNGRTPELTTSNARSSRLLPAPALHESDVRLPIVAHLSREGLLSPIAHHRALGSDRAAEERALPWLLDRGSVA